MKRVQQQSGLSPINDAATAKTAVRSASAAAATSSGTVAGSPPLERNSAASPGGGGSDILRPTVDETAADDAEIIRMMTKCWSEDPLDRPDFSALKVTIRRLNK